MFTSSPTCLDLPNKPRINAPQPTRHQPVIPRTRAMFSEYSSLYIEQQFYIYRSVGDELHRTNLAMVKYTSKLSFNRPFIHAYFCLAVFLECYTPHFLNKNTVGLSPITQKPGENNHMETRPFEKMQ